MSLYVIRHKKTKEFLPIEFTKGGSHWDGLAICYIPRIFKSKLAAANFVSAWVRGKATRGASAPSRVGIIYEDCGRKSSDLEILPIIITIGDKSYG